MSKKKQGMNRALSIAPDIVPDNLPGCFPERYTKEQMLQMAADIQLAKQEFRDAKGHEAPPSRVACFIQDALSRVNFVAAPSDLVRGFIQSGPHRGKKIRGALGLADGQRSGVLRVRLADDNTGIDTKMGSTSTDQSLIKSFQDTGLYGSTSAVVDPVLLSEMLITENRGNVWLPMAHQAPAPELTFRIPLKLSSLQSLLFEGDDFQTLKSTVVPKAEGGTGIHIRSKYGSGNFTCRGYMFDTAMTLEAMRSNAYRLLGIGQITADDLTEAPRLIDNYDMFLALWYALELGYTRRYLSSAWDVATQEVNFGKAEFITSNNKKHMAFYDYVNQAFYTPSADSDYRKYASAQAVSGIFAPTGNTVLDAMRYIGKMMDDKGKKLDAIFLDADLWTMCAGDERIQNTLYHTARNTPNFRFMGEEGYVGDMPIFGGSDMVSIFKVRKGQRPDVLTADSTPKSIPYLMVGCTLGRVVTNMPFLPLWLFASEEYAVVMIDDQNVTRKTLRDILTSVSISCVEPFDPRTAVILKCMAGSPGGA